MFQFHSGSIQTCLSSNFGKAQFVFQFHSGSIQTRLRLAGSHFLQDGFNSTLVRFKPFCTAVVHQSAFLFQFHSGSIQTREAMALTASAVDVSIPLWFDSNRYDLPFVCCCGRCFNSTLVRFKRYAERVLSVERGRFNSTLVRFKPHSTAFVALRAACFNSTLVRFKLPLPIAETSP